jgi:hypothetical protein
MIIECRKGEQAFSRLINQPGQKAVFCFLRAISLQQKSTNFLLKFVSKSWICGRNLKISTFDCRYYKNILAYAQRDVNKRAKD